MNRLVSILILVLLVSLHMSYPSSYVERYAAFYVLAVALICIGLFLKRDNVTRDVCNILAFAYLLFLFADGIIRRNTYGSDFCCFMIVCWLLFLVLSMLFLSRHIQKSLICSIIVCAWIEIVVGFGQLYGLMENGNAFFQFGGSLGNPGAYSGYLSVIFPIVLSVYLTCRRNRDCENVRYLLLACLIFMLALIFLSRSRGAWLACLIGCVFVIEHYYGVLKSIRRHFSRTQRLVLSVLLGVGLLGGVFFLYKFKADSADGRLLVWKVALQAPRENILLGDGCGSFEANYCRWQRDYFASGEGTEREKFLADYVTCAYNEFLQVFIDHGVVGTLLFFGIILLALLQKDSHRSHIFIGAKASLLGFLVLCCVSYPLHVQLMYLHLIVVLALLLAHRNKQRHRVGIWSRHIMSLCLLLVVVCVSLMSLHQLYGLRLLENGLGNAAHGDMTGAIKHYKKAYPIMSNNGIFLFYYASALSMANEPEKSIGMLKMAEIKSSDPHIYMLMGENYKKTGNLMAAREAYQKAINTIPSRLYPRSLIVHLLMDMGHKTEAYKLANEILQMKEKVPTTAGKEIKGEMRLIVNRLSNPQNRLPMK